METVRADVGDMSGIREAAAFSSGVCVLRLLRALDGEAGISGVVDVVGGETVTGGVGWVDIVVDVQVWW